MKKRLKMKLYKQGLREMIADKIIISRMISKYSAISMSRYFRKFEKAKRR